MVPLGTDACKVLNLSHNSRAVSSAGLKPMAYNYACIAAEVGA